MQPAFPPKGGSCFFTRAHGNRLAIYLAIRPRVSVASGEPARMEAIEGFAEAPTLSPDERSLYYHKREGGRFVIYRVNR